MFTQLINNLAARRKRVMVRRLLAGTDIRELTWMPPAGSPLRHGQASVRLAMDHVIGPRTLAFGHWHDEHCQLLRARMDSASSYHLIDVGANAGLVSRQLLTTPGMQFCGADCFEPDPHNFALLTHNLAPFAGVHLHAAALSDHDGEAEIFRGARNAGDISLSPDAQLRSRTDLQGHTVPLLSAQRLGGEILARLAPGTRLVWKSDTQGHDLKIVASMPDAIWERVEVALVELRSVDATPAELERFMAVVARFPVRRSVKFGARDIGLEAIRRFILEANDREIDLLLARR
jgi:FkbM family methyltransferase